MALNIRGDKGLYYKTGIDTAGLKKGATKSKGILAGLKSSITKMDVFFAIGVSAGLAFTKASKAMYQFSKEFEQNMLEVATISKLVSNDFEGMSLKIMELSRQFPETALILTKGLYQIVSAGYDTAQALDILRESTKLATAAVTDTFIAADAVTSVMNAYTDSVSGAAEVTDKLFTIVRLGKTTMAELGPHITMVTGLAAQAGMTFQELSAIIAESVKTLKTPIAMTGIRGMLTAIMKPTEDTIKVMEDLKLVTGETGFEFDIATARSMGFVNFLKKVMELTKGDTALLAQMFPNIRGLTGLLSIATDEGNRLSAAMEEIANSTKAVDVAVETMSKSTMNKIKIMTNNIIADLKVYGDAMVGIGGKVAEETNSFLSFLRTISAVELESRAAFRLWYNDIYFFLDDLTKKALDFNEAISGEKLPVTGKEQFPTTRREQIPSIFTAQQLKNIGAQLEEYTKLRGEAIDFKEPEAIPGDYAKYVQRQAALIRESLALTKTYEEKVMEIRKHFSELRSVVDDKEGKNRLKALESKEIKVLYEKTFADRIENEKRMTEGLERERERQEDFTVEMTLLQEKEYAEKRKLDEEYREWKISNNKDLLEDEIEKIEAEMELHDEETNFKMGLTEELASKKEQLERFEIINNRLTLSEILKDTRGMSKKELIIYRNKIDEQIKLAKGNAALQNKLNEEVFRVTQEIYNKILDNIDNLNDTFQSLIKFIDMFDNELASSARNLSNMVTSISRFRYEIEQLEKAQARSKESGEDLSIWEKLPLITSEINLIIAATNTWKDVLAAVGLEIGKFHSDLEDTVDLLSILRGISADYARRLQVAIGTEQITILMEQIADIERTLTEQVSGLSQAEINYLKAELKLIENQLREVLTGTTTESIAAAITDGLMEGLDSAQVFADTFEDLMRNALLHAFETRTLMRLLDPFFDKFAELAEGGLTREEIDELKIMWLGTKRKGKLGGEFDVPGISDAIEGAFEGMKRFMEEIGISLIDKEAGVSATRTGMTGAIRGITERTAGILAGQLGAMRLDVRQIRDRLLGEDEATDLINMHLLAISQKASTRNVKLNEIMISSWGTKGYTQAILNAVDKHGLAISQKMSDQKNMLNEIMLSGWTIGGWTRGTMNHALAISQKLSSQKVMLNEIMVSNWGIQGFTNGIWETAKKNLNANLRTADNTELISDHTMNLEHMNNRLASIDSSLKNGGLNLTLNDTSMLRASGTN